MSDILALARPDIVALKAYSHASWDPAFEYALSATMSGRASARMSLMVRLPARQGAP